MRHLSSDVQVNSDNEIRCNKQEGLSNTFHSQIDTNVSGLDEILTRKTFVPPTSIEVDMQNHNGKYLNKSFCCGRCCENEWVQYKNSFHFRDEVCISSLTNTVLVTHFARYRGKYYKEQREQLARVLSHVHRVVKSNNIWKQVRHVSDMEECMHLGNKLYAARIDNNQDTFSSVFAMVCRFQSEKHGHSCLRCKLKHWYELLTMCVCDNLDLFSLEYVIRYLYQETFFTHFYLESSLSVHGTTLLGSSATHDEAVAEYTTMCFNPRVPLQQDIMDSPVYEEPVSSQGEGRKNFLRSNMKKVAAGSDLIAIREFFKVLLGSSKKEIPNICTEILHVVYRSDMGAKFQSVSMQNFHKYLCKYSVINKSNASIYADHLFVKSQGWFSFKHEHTVRVEKVEDLLQQLVAYFKRLGICALQMGFLTKLLWLLYDYFTGVPVSVALLRLATTASNYIPERVLEKTHGLFTVLKDYFVRQTGVRAQSNLKQSEGVVKSFAVLAYNLFTGDTFEERFEDKLRMGRVIGVSKLLGASKNISAFIFKLVTSGFKFLQGTLQTEREKVAELERLLPEVGSWLAEFDKLDSMEDDESMIQKINKDPRVARQFIDMKLRSSKWLPTLERAHANQPFWMIFMDRYRRFIKFYDVAALVLTNSKFRPAPFIIALVGGAGAGKSHLNFQLMDVIHRILGKPFNAARDIYTRNQKNEFWDAYRNQPVVYYNDLFQTTNLEVNVCVSQEFITMGQNLPMPLNCAVAERKDTLYFDSRIVTTDMNYFPSDQSLFRFVSEPEAIKRRFPNVIDVMVIPEWRDANGRLDKTKVTRPFHPEAYRFSFRGGLRDVDWKGFLTELMRRYHVHEQHEERVMTRSDNGLTEEDIEAIRLQAVGPVHAQMNNSESLVWDYTTDPIWLSDPYTQIEHWRDQDTLRARQPFVHEMVMPRAHRLNLGGDDPRVKFAVKLERFVEKVIGLQIEHGNVWGNRLGYTALARKELEEELYKQKYIFFRDEATCMVDYLAEASIVMATARINRDRYNQGGSVENYGNMFKTPDISDEDSRTSSPQLAPEPQFVDYGEMFVESNVKSRVSSSSDSFVQLSSVEESSDSESVGLRSEDTMFDFVGMDLNSHSHVPAQGYGWNPYSYTSEDIVDTHLSQSATEEAQPHYNKVEEKLFAMWDAYPNAEHVIPLMVTVMARKLPGWIPFIVTWMIFYGLVFVDSFYSKIVNMYKRDDAVHQEWFVHNRDVRTTLLNRAAQYIRAIRRIKIVIVVVFIAWICKFHTFFYYLLKQMYKGMKCIWNTMIHGKTKDVEIPPVVENKPGGYQRLKVVKESSEPKDIGGAKNFIAKRKTVNVEGDSDGISCQTDSSWFPPWYATGDRHDRVKEASKVLAEGSKNLKGMMFDNMVMGLTDDEQNEHINSLGKFVPRKHFHSCVQCSDKYSHVHAVPNPGTDLPSHRCPTCIKGNDMSEAEVFAQGSLMPGSSSMMLRFGYSCVKVISPIGSICGFFVGTRIVCIPNHYFETLDDDESMVLLGPNYRVELSGQDRKHYVVEKERDIRLIYISHKMFPAKSSLLKYFVSSQDKLPVVATLVNPRQFDGKHMVLGYHAINDLGETSHIEWDKSEKTELINNIHSALMYKANTEMGDCGSPLCVLDNSGCLRIAGMHMAGGRGIGLSTFITKETLVRMIEELVCKTPVISQGDLNLHDINELPGRGTPLCQSDDLLLMGNLPSSMVPILSTKSSIEPSLLYDAEKAKTQPAMLSITNNIDPLRKGLLKMARGNVELKRDILDEATDIVRKHLLSLSSPGKVAKRLLTEKECLNGVQGEKWILPINMRTSPGWPYKLKAKKQGKFDFVEGESGSYTLTPFMREEVTKLEDSLLSSAPEPVVFFDCLKDERRTKEKAVEGSTRVFNVGPMNFTLLLRKYTAFFQAHCMHNCITSGSAVGINPHSSDWAHLLTELNEAGTNYIAGDFEKWDKWIPYPLFMCVCDLVNDFYDDGEENRLKREAIFATAYGSIRIAKHNVYRTTGGLPSGIPGTAVFSSIANRILVIYMFLFMKDHYQPTLNVTYIHRLIRTTAYGDDHVVSVNGLIPWFNMQTLAHTFEYHDIPYTSADKSTKEFSMRYVSLQDLTYLKRRFVKDSDFHIRAPLPKEVIEEILLWRHRGGDAVEDLKATAVSALLEAVHHGETWFKILDRHISRSLQALDISPPVVSYRETLRVMREGGLGVYGARSSDIGISCGNGDTEEDGVVIPNYNKAGSGIYHLEPVKSKTYPINNLISVSG